MDKCGVKGAGQERLEAAINGVYKSAKACLAKGEMEETVIAKLNELAKELEELADKADPVASPVPSVPPVASPVASPPGKEGKGGPPGKGGAKGKDSPAANEKGKAGPPGKGFGDYGKGGNDGPPAKGGGKGKGPPARGRGGKGETTLRKPSANKKMEGRKQTTIEHDGKSVDTRDALVLLKDDESKGYEEKKVEKQKELKELRQKYPFEPSIREGTRSRIYMSCIFKALYSSNNTENIARNALAELKEDMTTTEIEEAKNDAFVAYTKCIEECIECEETFKRSKPTFEDLLDTIDGSNAMKIMQAAANRSLEPSSIHNLELFISNYNTLVENLKSLASWI